MIVILNGSVVLNKLSVCIVCNFFFGVNISNKIFKSGEKMKNVNNKLFIVNFFLYRVK